MLAHADPFRVAMFCLSIPMTVGLVLTAYGLRHTQGWRWLLNIACAFFAVQNANTSYQRLTEAVTLPTFEGAIALFCAWAYVLRVTTHDQDFDLHRHKDTP